MTDVRSLLKSERASRKITHPHATYSASGALRCQPCGLVIKADSLWELHIKSAKHIKLAQEFGSTKRKREEETSIPLNKKRKALSDEEEEGDAATQATGVKRSKGEDMEPAGPFNDHSQIVAQREPAQDDQPSPILASGTTAAVGNDDATTVEAASPAIDEDEWAAFEREVAGPANGGAMTALDATAAIEVAPKSAAELAAEAREEQSVQRDNRQAELEAEKEDAARQLEEDLEQLDEMEGRLQKLREKREAARIGRVDQQPPAEPAKPTHDSEEDSGETSDSDDYEDFGFG